jgi:putative hydrolase of the HAD superfamily
MAEPPIDAVTLDAGNTLLYCSPSPAAIYAEHLSRYGPAVTADVVGPVFRDAWAEMQNHSRSGTDRYTSTDGGEKAWWGRFVRRVLAGLDHPAPWRPLLDDLYDAFSKPEIWKTFPDTVPALKQLRGRGVRLAVISNWDRRLPTILDDLELTSFFDTITVSSLEGVEKPAPEIFCRTLDRLGVAPECAIHVGDSPHDDYEGADGVGIHPLLLDRNGLFAGDGYRRVSSLIEAVDMMS